MRSIVGLKAQVMVHSLAKSGIYGVFGAFFGSYITHPLMSPIPVLLPKANFLLADAGWLVPLFALLGLFYGWSSTIRERALVDVAMLIGSIESSLSK